MKNIMPRVMSIVQAVTYPTVSKCCSGAFLAGWYTMSPAAKEAIPPETCWMEEFMPMYAPRSFRSGTPEMSAEDEIMRDEIPVYRTILVSMTTQIGFGPKCV